MLTGARRRGDAESGVSGLALHAKGGADEDGCDAVDDGGPGGGGFVRGLSGGGAAGRLLTMHERWFRK